MCPVGLSKTSRGSSVEGSAREFDALCDLGILCAEVG